MLAAQSGHAGIVELLLRKGAKINEAEGGLMSPLMLAVFSSSPSIELVELLLNSGAEIDAITRRNFTALMLAIEKENIEAVKIAFSKRCKSRYIR